MIPSWLRRFFGQVDRVSRDPFSLLPLSKAEREAIERRAFAQDWKARQKANLLALQGASILRWQGVQWAVGGGDEHAAVWVRDDIPWLQLDVLEFRRNDGAWYRIVATQGDYNWPIACEAGEPLSTDSEPPAFGILSWSRTFPELPVGEVSSANLECDDEDAIIGIRLRVGGHDLLIRSGEVVPDWDDTYQINFEDEYLLVQVDGRLPSAP
jgi:hypothetical protein